jgi:hypothetical protein
MPAFFFSLFSFLFGLWGDAGCELGERRRNVVLNRRTGIVRLRILRQGGASADEQHDQHDRDPATALDPPGLHRTSLDSGSGAEG